MFGLGKKATTDQPAGKGKPTAKQTKATVKAAKEAPKKARTRRLDNPDRF